MKFYVVVRLPRAEAYPQKNVALPVTYTSRAPAQEACNVLNGMREKNEPEFVVEEREEIGKASGQSM
jgi:hypothetical protein